MWTKIGKQIKQDVDHEVVQVIGVCAFLALMIANALVKWTPNAAPWIG